MVDLCSWRSVRIPRAWVQQLSYASAMERNGAYGTITGSELDTGHVASLLRRTNILPAVPLALACASLVSMINRLTDVSFPGCCCVFGAGVVRLHVPCRGEEMPCMAPVEAAVRRY